MNDTTIQFKAGDKVRYVNKFEGSDDHAGANPDNDPELTLTIGEVYTVTGTVDESVRLDGKKQTWLNSRFELATGEPVTDTPVDSKARCVIGRRYRLVAPGRTESGTEWAGLGDTGEVVTVVSHGNDHSPCIKVSTEGHDHQAWFTLPETLAAYPEPWFEPGDVVVVKGDSPGRSKLPAWPLTHTVRGSTGDGEQVFLDQDANLSYPGEWFEKAETIVEEPTREVVLERELAEVREQLAQSRNETYRAKADGQLALDTLMERVNQAADNPPGGGSRWCSDFDAEIERLEQRLPDGYTLLRRVQEWDVTWTEYAQVRISRTVRVSATSREDAIEAAQENDEGASRSDVRDAVDSYDYEIEDDSDRYYEAEVA